MAILTYTEPPPSPKLLTFFEFAAMQPGTLGRIEKPGDSYHGLYVMSLTAWAVASFTKGHYWTEVTKHNYLKVWVLPPNSTITLTQEDI